MCVHILRTNNTDNNYKRLLLTELANASNIIGPKDARRQWLKLSNEQVTSSSVLPSCHSETGKMSSKHLQNEPNKVIK